MQEPDVVRLFGRSGPSRAMMRWLLAALVGICLACTLVVLSGCAAQSCALARATGYYCPEELQKKMAGGKL